MSQELDVSPGEVTSAAPLIEEVGMVAKEISDEIVNGLATLGNFAGNDATGDAFWGQWNPAIAATVDLLNGFTKTLGQMTDALVSTAALYSKADDVNAEVANASTATPTQLP
jgi:hypothetical protein